MCFVQNKEAYFGIFKNGTADLKGLTAIKSNSPNFIQNVFQNCVKELAHVKNEQEYEQAKARIVRVVQNAIKDLKNEKVELKDLVYTVKLYHDPSKSFTRRFCLSPTSVWLS